MSTTTTFICPCCGGSNICCRSPIGNCCFGVTSTATVVFHVEYPDCADCDPDCRDPNCATLVDRTDVCSIMFVSDGTGCRWEKHTDMAIPGGGGTYDQVTSIGMTVVDGGLAFSFVIGGYTVSVSSEAPVAGNCAGFTFSGTISFCPCWHDPDPEPIPTVTVTVTITPGNCVYDSELDECVEEI